MLTEEQKRIIEQGGTLRGLAAQFGVSVDAIRRYKRKYNEKIAPKLTEDTVAVMARCPYFRRAKESTIFCEGPVEGSKLRWDFRTRKEWVTQVETFCCEKYEYCEIYRAIDEVQGQ